MMTTIDETNEKAIRSMAAFVRKEIPPLLPFRVYIRDAEKMPKGCGLVDGLCVLNEGKSPSFSIYIARGTLKEMVDVLVHEIGHAKSWSSEIEDDHNAAWGIASAQIYRALEGWNI